MDQNEILKQLLQGQTELLHEVKEIRRELAELKEELKTTSEATAYLARDVLILKNKIS